MNRDVSLLIGTGKLILNSIPSNRTSKHQHLLILREDMTINALCLDHPIYLIEQKMLDKNGLLKTIKKMITGML